VEKNSVKEIEKNRKKKKKRKKMVIATNQISLFLHWYGKCMERTHLYLLSSSCVAHSCHIFKYPQKKPIQYLSLVVMVTLAPTLGTSNSHLDSWVSADAKDYLSLSSSHSHSTPFKPFPPFSLSVSLLLPLVVTQGS